MTKENLFINILFLIIAIIFSAISQCSSALSDKRLCYNPDCSEPVSLARTTIKYIPNEPGLLKFDVSVKVTVYSKEAGNRTDLWGVEINGKHGYVPKRFLKEYKVIHKDLQYEVPINQLSNNNLVSNEKLQPKKDNNKSAFDTKDIEASSTKADNLDVKSTEELPHNVTPSYAVIDGTTVHLDPMVHDEPSVQPASVTGVVKATIVPNKQDTVDNLEVNFNKERNESDIFTKDAESPQKLLNDELKVKEQSTSDNLNIKDFITSSEETFDLQDSIGVAHIPSVEATENLKTKVENEVENLQNSLPSTVKDAPVLDSNTDINISQTPTSDDIKEELKDKAETTTEVDRKDNVDSNETIASSVYVQNTENIVLEEKDLQTSENVTLLETDQNELKVEIKNTEDLSNVSSITLETNVTSATEGTLLTKNDKDSVKNAIDIDKVVDKLLENDKESKIEQSQLKEESRKNEDSNEHSNEHVAPFFLESVVKSTVELFSDVSKDEKSEEKTKPVETVEKSEEKTKPVETDVKSEEKTKPVEIDVKSEEKTKPVETDVKSEEKTKPVETDVKSDEKAKPVETDVKSEEKTKPVETLSNIENTKVEVTPEAETVLFKFESQDSDLNLKEDTNATTITNEESDQELNKKQNTSYETYLDMKEINEIINKTTEVDDNLKDVTDASNYSVETPQPLNEIPETKPNLELSELYPAEKDVISENVMNINQFHNRNLLNVETDKQFEIENEAKSEIDNTKDNTLVEDKNDKIVQSEIPHEGSSTLDTPSVIESTSENIPEIQEVPTPDVCTADNDACPPEDSIQNDYANEKETFEINGNTIIEGIEVEPSYWLTLMYVSVTATATLVFSLGYYYIENMRRDRQLIAKVNKLEKDLLVATKECTMLNDELKTMKEELTQTKDDEHNLREKVHSLWSDLEASEKAKAGLEDQIVTLEKDLESATEAGLELERMLREVLSSNNEVNPLAQSVEDLQARLNAQQAANESLTNALNLKNQELEFDKFENESLSTKLVSLKKQYEEVEVELARLTENLKLEKESKNSLERTLTDKVQQLEMQIKEISTEKATLQKKLKDKEVETKDLLEVINRLNSNNLDLDKLYDVSHIKAEATALLEERNELKVRLVEVEGAHHLLEEHMKVVKEEITTLSEQCKIAEKEKKDAETRLEVLTKFFEEKEAQRQKEEAIWLQQQGEVVSTVERIQTMQNEIQNYKQQIEMLKREILDQEREYKNQISVLETKAHEQWVIARQVERRLEESRVEAGQLRNRLTLIEKNINDADSEAKLHRLEANGETATSPPLFIGAESSSSPIMFSGSSNVPPPPPPSYLHSLFPPYLPPPLPNASGVPPYEVSQRPAPLGGRLSSPPPMPLHHSASNRYDNAGSPPPPMSPHLLPPFNHRSPPPPPFGSDIHPPLPPPPDSILPPPRGTPRSWGDESLPHPRNSGFHPPRERIRNHKGSLHSSGESLDKTHHNSKV